MKMSKIESAMRVVLEYNKAFNRHDVAAMMELVSNDCIYEHRTPAPDGAVYSGKDEVSLFWQAFFRQSPHAQIEIEDIFGFSYHCVMRWKHNWTDASGAKRHMRGVDLFRVKDGCIHEQRSYVKG